MYAYVKTIACLANSRKTSGRCIAGKEYENGAFGDWIRPVSDRPDEEISEEDRRYQTGDYANLLHIIDVPMTRYAPDGFQTENHLIDDGYYWSQHGTLAWHELAGAVDDVENLWINGFETYHGSNDRVPEDMLDQVQGSLLFLGPLSLDLGASAERAAFGNTKRTVRAYFNYRRVHYAIRVTDPVIEREYVGRNDGPSHIEEAFVCVSLAKAWKGFAYKLVAAIITPERAI